MTRHPQLDVDSLRQIIGAPSWHAFARRTGVDWRVLMRARDEGLTIYMADRWAVRCGLHPAVVWTAWADVIADPSPADWKRRKYHTDPEFREAEKARARSYYAVARRAVLIKRRADRERINARRRERRRERRAA